MGGNNSTPKPDTERQGSLSTAAPTTSSAPCLSNHRNKEHLILAFCVGVLLTLLLMAFIFLIIKSYRKCKQSPGDRTALLSLPLRLELAVTPSPKPWILTQILQPWFHASQSNHLPVLT
ncbi:transmembrane protein C1orf162 homolog isoform X2 [Cebus imitator]|uniref:transmembrane protein C1orf162 homolog isoform X2 n=1 Tax=Cebus imitator TaxID=2715852 RepID=UPI00189A9849|nr:transmembrane protein C1orf162 homolog isoform X2 [Cebus imitator]